MQLYHKEYQQYEHHQNELVESLMKVMSPIVYRGCTISPSNGNYLALGEVYETLNSAKLAVDNAFVVFGEGFFGI